MKGLNKSISRISRKPEENYNQHAQYEENRKEMLIKLEEKLQEVIDYYKYMDMDAIHAEFTGDEVEEMLNEDILRVNHERDMFEVTNFEL